MSEIKTALDALKDSLCKQISVGELIARNPIIHKWKAPWRVLLVRESVAWRLQDLLEQSLVLSDRNHLLGARILLRSALETVAVLIYLNRAIRAVVRGDLDFQEFSEKTVKVLLGSRNNTTDHQQISILTVLKSADKSYPGLYELYESLSENAHPNFEGMIKGYTSDSSTARTMKFENTWAERYGEKHEEGLMICLSIFVEEYDNHFIDATEELENWVLDNEDKCKSN